MSFSFKKRRLPFDWDLIRTTDPSFIKENVDISFLQSLITPMTFCDFSMDPVLSTAEPSIRKLVSLYQYIVEYVIFIQQQLSERNNILQQELVLLRAINDTTRISKECQTCFNEVQDSSLAISPHFSSPSSTPFHYTPRSSRAVYSAFVCKFCGKVFVSQEYLSAHIDRRHFDLKEKETPIFGSKISDSNLFTQSPGEHLENFKTNISNTVDQISEKVENQPVDIELPESKVNSSELHGDEAKEDEYHGKIEVESSDSHLSFDLENYSQIQSEIRDEIQKEKETLVPEEILRVIEEPSPSSGSDCEQENHDSSPSDVQALVPVHVDEEPRRTPESSPPDQSVNVSLESVFETHSPHRLELSPKPPSTVNSPPTTVNSPPTTVESIDPKLSLDNEVDVFSSYSSVSTDALTPSFAGSLTDSSEDEENSIDKEIHNPLVSVPNETPIVQRSADLSILNELNLDSFLSSDQSFLIGNNVASSEIVAPFSLSSIDESLSDSVLIGNHSSTDKPEVSSNLKPRESGVFPFSNDQLESKMREIELMMQKSPRVSPIKFKRDQISMQALLIKQKIENL
ncbi:hypothetical protein RCL1_000341 [Eukaryota sp. TZLM3-RCL]